MYRDPVLSTGAAQVVLGILVIGMGLVFLLDNLGIWDFHNAIHFWPMLFILVGVVKMCDTRSSNRYFLGAVLILIGVILTLNRLGLIYFSWRTMWPLLLILFGASVLYKAITGRRFISSAMKVEQASNTVADVTAILGNFERRISTPTFRGGEATTIMGGCVLDMRDSSDCRPWRITWQLNSSGPRSPNGASWNRN
jgi:hypothetical protein